MIYRDTIGLSRSLQTEDFGAFLASMLRCQNLSLYLEILKSTGTFKFYSFKFKKTSAC